jgi:hypothetical protein
MVAASASWHFLQGFLSAFPQYNPGNPGTRPSSNKTEPTAINLFGESYGGMYVPAFAEYYESQNLRRSIGDLSPTSTLEIKLSSVGIINGIVDEDIQDDSLVQFAAENDYGIQVLGVTEEHNVLSVAGEVCHLLIAKCRESVAKEDPFGEGDENPTNTLCRQAQVGCAPLHWAALSSGRSPYDIRAVHPSSHPSNAFLEYLNTAAVQQSIGAPVNFTLHNNVVNGAFHDSESKFPEVEFYSN